MDAVQTWKYSVDARQHGFFLAKRVRGRDGAPDHADNADNPHNSPPTSPAATLGFHWVVGAIDLFETGFFQDLPPEDQFICFADPSTYRSYPCWLLRNLLVLMRYRWRLRKAQVLCYRDTQARRHEGKSIVIHLEIGTEPASDFNEPSRLPQIPPNPLKITGWERNHVGKFASKVANLGEYMDPQR